MNLNRNIILTFDYELFLGERSGDVNSCMVLPTQKLQSIFDEFGIQHAIFFVDTTYLACLKRNFADQNTKSEFESIRNNIIFLLEKGHYIFPHIHPHWLNAKRQGNDWVLTDLTKYCFKNCTIDERNLIWNETMEILRDFGVENYHPIDAFRAGGWSIQPFSDFTPYFEKYGIQYDFTVMPGTFSWTNAQQYDFTQVVDERPYQFDQCITSPVGSGRFVEMPISTRTKKGSGIGERVLLKYLWKTGNQSFGTGKGVIPQKMDYETKAEPKNLEMISIELLHALNCSLYKKCLDENSYIQFISHPKMLTIHNLKYFRKFIKYATQNYNVNFDFKSLI